MGVMTITNDQNLLLFNLSLVWCKNYFRRCMKKL